MKEQNPWCYVGRRKSCGCIVAAAVDTPGDEKETAKFVAERITEGLTIDRMRAEDVRKSFGCDHREQEALPL